jgi:gamma-glutamyl-gamma-aminobutyraldehyde dehydrogenase
MLIDGRSVDAASGETFATVNPATGQVLAQVPRGESQDVDRAVRAARKAFNEGPWPKLAPAERKKALLRLADLMESNQEELAVLESLEAGKPVSDCRAIDLPETINLIRWHAEAADKIYDQLSPSGPNVVSMIVREPLGVVGLVLPWNFPLLVAAFKLGPSLACGNTVILKPAEQTSLSTIRLAELALEAGIPEGVVNVVTGFGETAGKAIGMHPDVDCIGFTGSTEVGRLFLTYAAQSNLKRVLLECGGKSPMVVLEDAGDLDAVAEHSAFAAFWNMGENCTANSRLLVHRSLREPLLERILQKAGEWIVGDPMDESTRVGALIEPAHMQKVLGHISGASEEGAKLVHGGRRVREESGGYFVEPTIFDGVSPDMRIFNEEVFGPVLGITAFDTVDEAIELANRTAYGLQASVFSGSRRNAFQVASRIRAGTVSVNCYSEGDATTPFGGYKCSGFVGRDKSLLAHDQYCEVKTVWEPVT